MKDDQRLDRLIKESLTAAYTPADDLNDTVKKRMEVKMGMKRRSSMRIGIVAAALVAVLSMTAFAAWNLLSPGNVAEQFGMASLSKAFSEEDGILINETQTAGDYRFTLLGVASGKGLNDLDENLDRDRSYSVMAVERISSPMPAMSDEAFYEEIDDFLISPLMKGIAPWRANIFTMGGSRSSTVIDGVLYLITECDNVEIFAHTGVYLAVTTNSISAENFSFNEATGEIRAIGTGAEGINLLFDLPLDPAKANPARAQAYLDDLNAQFDSPADADDDDLAGDDGEDPSFQIEIDGGFIEILDME